MRYIMFSLMLLSLVPAAVAHQWTPTYPILKPSFNPEIYVTTMLLFNKRSDVEYFEVKVYDGDFNPVRFGSTDRIMNVKPSKKQTVDVYIRKDDLGKAVYICSKSKHVSEDISTTIISSRICSKIK